MMLGTCDVKNDIVITHRTTYVLSKDTRPDVQRLFFGPSLVVSIGLTLFGFGFADILYIHEISLIGIISVASVFCGLQFARLLILDKVTRGTEQEIANYGMHSTLQAKRREINVEIERIKNTSSAHDSGDAS